MKKTKKQLDILHVILFAFIIVLTVYVSLLTSIVYAMNTESEDRDSFIMEQVVELQTNKGDGEAQR